MAESYRFRTVNGIRHLVLTPEEWNRLLHHHYTGIITDPNSPTGWPVGTKTALYWDQKHGTCLAPVIIDG